MTDLYDVSKEIVLKLIDKDNLTYDDFPEAKTYVDLVCEAYKQIFRAVNNPTS